MTAVSPTAPPREAGRSGTECSVEHGAAPVRAPALMLAPVRRRAIPGEGRIGHTT
jgi:hypothetical protein